MRKNNTKNKKSKRNYRYEGGSIMVPKEREGYPTGSEVRTPEYGGMYDDVYEGETLVRMRQVLEGVVTDEKEIETIRDTFNNEFPKEALNSLREDIKESRSDAASRATKVEGGMPREGLMAMPSEAPMEEPMEEPMDEAPEDTYANATPEEIEEAQVPDEQMEDDHLVFILTEALALEEREYLMQALENDQELSDIFDKVVSTAAEFSGEGEVEGPGTGISDSIPARLSDGEFVMTEKATEELGADNLQIMMDDAERAYDGGIMRKKRYLGGSITDNEEELGLDYVSSTDDEIRKLMSLKANKTPSLR